MLTGYIELSVCRYIGVNLFQFLQKVKKFLCSKKAYLKKSSRWKFCAGSKLLSSPSPIDYKVLHPCCFIYSLFNWCDSSLSITAISDSARTELYIFVNVRSTLSLFSAQLSVLSVYQESSRYHVQSFWYVLIIKLCLPALQANAPTTWPSRRKIPFE